MTVEQLWQPVPGGSGTYITELVRGMAHLDSVELQGLAARHTDTPSSVHEVALDVVQSRLPRAVLYEAWNRLGLPHAERTLRSRPDVVHATTWAIPPTTRPLVVTVHDLAFRRNPDHFTRQGHRFFERALARTRDEADIVIAPSQLTAADCEEAGIARGRIHVIPHGVRTRTPPRDELERFVRAKALPEKYLLWCGTHEPRKNLKRLLRAFEIAAARDPHLHLALVGPSGWKDDSGPRDAGTAADRVHVLGNLSWSELQCAYAGATAFCFPSLWEGFGMPVVEAMAHGLPIVTSRDSPMAVSADGAGILVDPTDVDDIAHGITRSTGIERASLATRSLAESQRFTWENAVLQTVDTYRAAAQATGTDAAPIRAR